MKETILKLHAIGAIKLGRYEVRRNFISPFQIDFSPVISNGALAKEVCSLLWAKLSHFKPELICGGSTAGSCFANFIAWDKEVPFILRKDGIEGKFKTGQSCLIIQDRFLAGVNSLETVDELEENGIKVRDILTFIDMELGGRKKIKQRGFVPHSVTTITEVLQILFDAGKIQGDSYKLATDFLADA